jgi:acetoacetyl-CoA synthetase
MNGGACTMTCPVVAGFFTLQYTVRHWQLHHHWHFTRTSTGSCGSSDSTSPFRSAEFLMPPDPDFVERSYLTEYRRFVNSRFDLSLDTYDDLHDFSVQRSNDFWMSLWDYLPVKASEQPKVAVDESIPIDEFPRFCEGARLNYAENMLSRTGSDIAVTALNEETLQNPERLSWDDLREKVRKFADALRGSDFVKGDVLSVI